jgi:hypothetical protein
VTAFSDLGDIGFLPGYKSFCQLLGLEYVDPYPRWKPIEFRPLPPTSSTTDVRREGVRIVGMSLLYMLAGCLLGGVLMWILGKALGQAPNIAYILTGIFLGTSVMTCVGSYMVLTGKRWDQASPFSRITFVGLIIPVLFVCVLVASIVLSFLPTSLGW